jgi:hypothetical protein
MSRTSRIPAILAVVALCWLGLCTGCSDLRREAARTQMPEVSAREAFAAAEKSVKEQYPDAYLKYDWMGSVQTSGRPKLYELKSSTVVRPQVEGGTAQRWEFEFFSPEHQLKMRVVVEGDAATITEPQGDPSVSRFPLEKWQLDSTEAFEKALGALTEKQRKNIPVPLEMRLSEPGGQILEATTNPCWHVVFYPRKLSASTPIVIVSVDALTGDIVRVFETTESYRVF